MTMMMPCRGRISHLIAVFSILWICQFTYGDVGSDGYCNLLGFLPFTWSGNELPHYQGKRKNNLGFSHLVAASMAAFQFTARDPSVVPELRDEIFQKCTIKLDTNRSQVFDTGVIGQQAIVSLQESLIRNGKPCVLVGPYFDGPATELSILAASNQIPLVVYRSLNFMLTIQALHPLTSQVYPTISEITPAMGEFLRHKDRADFVAVLYVLTDRGLQVSGSITRILEIMGAQWKSFGYLPTALEVFGEFDLPSLAVENNNLTVALRQIKASGYRTIIVVSELIDLETSIPIMADDAERLGLNKGGHFWMYYGGLELTYVTDTNIQQHPRISKLLRGAALITPVENFMVDPENDRFLQSWRNQNSTLLEYVRRAHPIQDPSHPAYYNIPDNYFQTVDPEAGAAFAFDAVMTAAMGSCHAQESEERDVNIPGLAHLDGIRRVTFAGASGPVSLGGYSVSGSGARHPSTVPIGVFNLLPPDDDQGLGYRLTDTSDMTRIDEDIITWSSRHDFYFADGTTKPPPLRDEPEQNFLSPSYRSVGLTLFAISTALSVISSIWIVINRNHRILRASQPIFLLLVCFGAFVTSFAILMVSFDESHGLTETTLGRFCTSLPWLGTLGYILIYGGLFTKLWRVNKVLSFSRAKIDMKRIVGPVWAMFATAVVVLSVWTAVSPFEWVRDEVNVATGESFGMCRGEHSTYWFTPILLIMAVPTALTFVMSWKTKDVDESFSEAWWIFALIFVQLQTVIVSLPLVVILRDVSTNGRYIGFTLMIWIIPMSTIALIILPKVVSYYKHNNIDNAGQGGAGSHHQSSVPVSANNAPSASSSSQAKVISGVTNGSGYESQDSTAGELAGKESSTEPK